LPCRKKTTTKGMNHNELTHFAGFDWASDHHDVVIVDPRGQIVADFRFEHTVEGWTSWRQKTAAYPKLGVAIETSAGLAVDQLLEDQGEVYPVNPLNAKRYRERKNSSGDKSDRLDAWALADALRLDGHTWRPLDRKDPIIEELRLLCRDEVSLIEERTALVCQLQAALREYYPAALEAFEDWTCPHAWAFIERFPTAAILVKGRKKEWDKFLHERKLFRPSTYPKRIAVFEGAGQWKVSAGVVKAKSLYAVAKARQLRVLESQLADYRNRIQALLDSHPDSGLFGSLPGAGPKLSARLLSEIGSDRTLFDDAKGLQCLAGTAPVSYQSGKVKKVRVRWACNKHLRHAIHLFADQSRQQCPWASAYYKALRERGQTHAQALRCLGQRWLKIIWKMWQTGKAYDPELHQRNQIAHGSWVIQFKPS